MYLYTWWHPWLWNHLSFQCLCGGNSAAGNMIVNIRSHSQMLISRYCEQMLRMIHWADAVVPEAAVADCNGRDCVFNMRCESLGCISLCICLLIESALQQPGAGEEDTMDYRTWVSHTDGLKWCWRILQIPIGNRKLIGMLGFYVKNNNGDSSGVLCYFIGSLRYCFKWFSWK